MSGDDVRVHAQPEEHEPTGTVEIAVERTGAGTDLALPQEASAGSAGVDLMAALGTGRTLLIEVGGRALVPTGLRLALPEGWEGQVRPRSGLALHDGVTVLNAPGTIDSDYRGEIGVILANFGPKVFTVHHGMRIAQLVIGPVARIAWRVHDLSKTKRDVGGFGSTGQ